MAAIQSTSSSICKQFLQERIGSGSPRSGRLFSDFSPHLSVQVNEGVERRIWMSR